VYVAFYILRGQTEGGGEGYSWEKERDRIIGEGKRYTDEIRRWTVNRRRRGT